MERYTILQARFTVHDRDAFIEQIRRTAEREDCAIICVNADRTAGLPHVQAALARAIRAHATGTGIARSLEMEALLNVAGSRQCAIGAEFGVRAGCNRAFVALVPFREDARVALAAWMDFVCEDWEGIDAVKQRILMDLFGITDAELDAAGEDQVRALVLERIALREVSR
jgi:KEOPS complex subunit Cgi121